MTDTISALTRDAAAKDEKPVRNPPPPRQRKQSKKHQASRPQHKFEPVTPPGYPVLTPVNVAKQLKANSTEATPGTTDPRWWCYPLIAFFGVQANCAAVRLLAFADYVSVGLMMNLTIPFVSFLSYIMRYRTYSWRHVSGSCIATIGGGTLFLGSYYRDEMDTAGSQQTYGCFLVMLAAFMYGACNVTNQLFLNVHTADQIVESVGLIGSCGSVITMNQMLLFERAEVTAVVWSGDVGLCFAGHIVAMLAFYLVVSLLPQASSSVIYNLSVLTSNLYLVFVSSALFGEAAHDYFCIALVLVLAGLTMHCLEHSKEDQAASADSSKPHPSFNSMYTPNDLKLIKIQIEHAAL